jgi:FKBP-type peptidyl-prolyl cis-trans isomerase FkpA
MKDLKEFALALSILIIGFTFYTMANANSPQENKAAGIAFLTANAQKENIKTTKSGLQYEILTQGQGPSPTIASTVTVHYRGTTIDGSEFDSSYSRNAPATFPLNSVIPGWTEGVQLMNVGSKYRFFIPSELAYGERGAGGDIGPNETLIFEVELLKF